MKVSVIFCFILLVSIIGCNGQHKNPSLKDSNRIDKSKYSNNPGVCEDTCFGNFNELGKKRIGKTLNIYISGRNVDILKDCCQWTFGEIVYNNNPGDPTLEVIKTHLVDLDSLPISNSSEEYANETVKKKVICICINNIKTGKMKIIVDPYHYGFYKKPKNWGENE